MGFKYGSQAKIEDDIPYSYTAQRRARDDESDDGKSKAGTRASAFSGAPVMSPIWLCNDNTPSLLSLTVICKFQDEEVGKAI